ncbi:T9SS type A sorting domain-containing protein [Reichenbachiella agariperforans]|uniref:T9SS type A sorting domain-containing protein n=1 Tax=Reichenbachiella agariperforans TaxID=156994 RepID=UPI001C08899C|nr:T9SS type A sorting domain-containing protein [Reichenbachiella agariperforans]MBU2913994.1 T9SS type A sorting domain-containing protein [Reichenbachiella agariperforans]
MKNTNSNSLLIRLIFIVLMVVSPSVVFADCPDVVNFFGLHLNGEDAAVDNCSYTDNLTVSGDLIVNGDMVINGNLSVDGSITVNGTLTVNGNFDVGLEGAVIVAEDGELHVTDDFNNGGDFFLWISPEDDTNAGMITVGGDFVNEENGNMTVEGTGTLDVEGQFISETGSTMDIEEGGIVVADGGYVGNGGSVTYDGEEIDWGVVDTQSGQPLPVELTYFKFEMKGKACLLVWETASELNNSGFEIQMKKTEGGVFESMTFVDGYGTTNEVHRYVYEVPLGAGKVYYRLKQLDYDGQYEYSPVIVVNGEGADDFIIYPNPTRGAIQSSGGDVVAYQLFDMKGQQVSTGSWVDTSRFDAELSAFLTTAHSGKYILSVQLSHSRKSLILIKE